MSGSGDTCLPASRLRSSGVSAAANHALISAQARVRILWGLGHNWQEHHLMVSTLQDTLSMRRHWLV